MSPGAWSPAVRQLAYDTVHACWSSAALPSEQLATVLAHVWAAQDWTDATAVARHQLSGLAISPQRYRAARDRKFDTFAHILRPYAHGDLLDVGAGGPDLLQRLPALTRTTTDIVPADHRAPDIEHVVQTHPDALPFGTASFDTVLMTGMAHHLDADVRARLLADVFRCLRPSGTVVLIEETFDRQSGCGVPREPSMRALSADFDAMTVADRLDFLRFTDWWGNRVMKGSDEIPLPMTFLDIEQWHAVLMDAGLPVRKVEQFGLMSGGGHLATPRAMMIGTRA